MRMTLSMMTLMKTFQSKRRRKERAVAVRRKGMRKERRNNVKRREGNAARGKDISNLVS